MGRKLKGYCLDENQENYALACLEFAARLEQRLTPSDELTENGGEQTEDKMQEKELSAENEISWDELAAALEQRRLAENERRECLIKEGHRVYGPVSFSKPAYLQYELTRYRLDFVTESRASGQNYPYREVTEAEKRRFYREHPQLFTRYAGDRFSYHETEMIIEKWIREMEYEQNIRDILCQRREGR